MNWVAKQKSITFTFQLVQLLLVYHESCVTYIYHDKHLVRFCDNWGDCIYLDASGYKLD